MKRIFNTITIWTRKLIATKRLVYLVAFAVACTSLFQYNFFTPALSVGMVASKSYLAPKDITFPSDVEYAHLKNVIERTVPTYLSTNSEIPIKQIAEVQTFFTALLEIKNSSTNSQTAITSFLEQQSVVLDPNTISQIIATSVQDIGLIAREVNQLMGSWYRQGILEEMTKIEVIQAKINQNANFEYIRKFGNFVPTILAHYLLPNTFPDLQRRDKEIQESVKKLSVPSKKITKGEYIVYKGEIISPEQFEVLEKFGFTTTQVDLLEMTLLAFLIAALTFLCNYFALIFARRSPTSAFIAVSYVLTLFILSLFLHIALPQQPLLFYLTPLVGIILLFYLLTDLALPLSLLLFSMGIIATIPGQNNDYLIFILISCLVGILAIQRVKSIRDILIAGVILAMTNSIATLFMSFLFYDLSLTSIINTVILAALNGTLSIVTVLLGAVYVAPFFGTLTFYQLLELGDPNHPLLLRLATEAPGTYHHSLLVSQLVECAAKRIGADDHLAKVSAMYHDIGKVLNPNYFIENQKHENPHNKLSPVTSAQRIISHVRDGITLAESYHLPPQIVSAIPAHHGTLKAKYFFAKALQQRGKNVSTDGDITLDHILQDDPLEGEDSDSFIKKFTYPGPKPHTKEQALIMIADAVEASTRALPDKNEATVKSVINTIIKERIMDGQLDDCSLSFRELKAIRSAFLDILKSIYHFRISYDLSSSVHTSKINKKISAEK